jgi:hypothetical protein
MIISDDIYRQIMWDYPISKTDIEQLLSGEIEHAGHYNRNSLFLKMLQSLPWFTLLETLGQDNIQELLSDELIAKLKSESMRKKYNYVKQRLREIISVAG